MLSSIIDSQEHKFYEEQIINKVYDNQIVRFKKRNTQYGYKPIEIDNQLLVYTCYNDLLKKHVGFILYTENEFKQIVINEKIEDGIYAVSATLNSGNIWQSNSCIKYIVKGIVEEPYLSKLLLHLITDFSNYEISIATLSSYLPDNELKNTLQKLFIGKWDRIENLALTEAIYEINILIEKHFPLEYANKYLCYLNKISFVFWQLEVLEKLPEPRIQRDVDVWKYEILPSLDWVSFQQVLIKLNTEQGATKQVEDAYKYLIERGWDIKSEDELLNVISFLEKFKVVFPSIQLQENNFECSINKFYFELHNKGLLNALSEKIIKQHIEELNTDDEKAEYIEKLGADQILLYYSLFPTLASFKEKYIVGIIDSEISKIDFLCFDLETNTDEIKEYAWSDNMVLKSNGDFIKFEHGLNELLTNLKSEKIIVGHNIKQFDLPILQNKYGLENLPSKMYDTLEMEMLINPTRQSYALNTSHNAIDDVRNTLAIFKCHILEFIEHKNLYLLAKDFLPPILVRFIENFSNNELVSGFSFFKESNSYNLLFRVTNSFHKLPQEFLNSIEKELATDEEKLIVLPKYLFELFASNYDVLFFEENSKYNYVLELDKITNYKFENSLHKSILINFISYHLKASTTPYYWKLPLAIKSQLAPELIFSICNDLLLKNDSEKKLLKVVTSNGLLPFCENKNNHPLPDTIITIAYDLIMFNEKIELGSDFDFSHVSNNLKNEPVLLNLSGGRNFNPITQNNAIVLGIDAFPDGIDNLWLEKTERAKFKVWCTIDFQNILNKLTFKNIININWNNNITTSNETIVVFPDFKKSHYSAEVNRVNPESTNRVLYWSAQFKIFNRICIKGTSNVLILNDSLEINKLQSYCRAIGYFIPDSNAQLARQIELLHSHSYSKKIIIISIDYLDSVIAFNNDSPINFIWDSFLLKEKEVMIGVNKFEKYFNNRDINSNSKIKKHFALDNRDLLLLHIPIVSFYKTLISENHSDSKLFLCDVRFSDYFDMEKSFNAKKIFFPLWTSELESKDDFIVASKYFSNKGSNADCSFKLEDAKDTLQKIFLNKGDNTYYEWRDYQIQYLDNILEAKNNLLISLPTGAGKSILFQGPALYRSAFTCKLSIVVTPLKALMNDQVEALHNKGFLSNVAYLSGDKSQSEILNILRKLVGGEIALLYITPERFRSRRFENAFLTRLHADGGLEFAIYDEAHCISQWGQEFRPDYLYSAQKISEFSKILPFKKLLFSATISTQVFNEIAEIIPNVIKLENTEQTYNPVRDHIKIQFRNNVRKADRLEEIANYLKVFNGELSRAIIFVRSRDNVDEFAEEFNNVVLDILGAESSILGKIGGYHAGMDAEDRLSIYEKYKSGEILILFATKAFGMGMDISNIHYLVHHRPPSTFEDFLQEIGRAGRNESSRLLAGFNKQENQINALCLTEENDFETLRENLQRDRISWDNIKETKTTVEQYYKTFLNIKPNEENFIALPFNLFSQKSKDDANNLDVIFRLGLHWLEKLNRIKLRYFTITHLNFSLESIEKSNVGILIDVSKEAKLLLESIAKHIGRSNLESTYIQIQIASLLQEAKLSMEKLFELLIELDKANILKTYQPIKIELTRTRTKEIQSDINVADDKYLALKLTFDFAKRLLKQIPDNDVLQFTGEEIQAELNELIEENFQNKQKLSWSIKEHKDEKNKELKKYITDFINKRAKHAFTIINSLPKAKHESKLRKENDIHQNSLIIQCIFNGYHKKIEWQNIFDNMQADCNKIVEYVNNKLTTDTKVEFNWLHIISALDIKPSFKYFSDLLFIIRILGYLKVGDLLPTGIETAIISEALINENDIDNIDHKIYNEFEETQKVRELKLVALQVLSKLPNEKHDSFIRSFFACDSSNSLLLLLQEHLSEDDDILIKWRGDAIVKRETQLNDEQRLVYNELIDTHINVIAGPGSGKTHTLALRVAKLIHHHEIKAETILVLAYNRAVVSELKIRLKKLFTELGYGTVVNKIKIFTFHGLAKKYCHEETKGKPFDEWEDILLKKLTDEGGSMMVKIGNLKHILVDEFQDINKVRIDLLNRFHELTDAKLFIIGDRNQSIYGYERIKEAEGTISPLKYYEDFYKLFKPKKFELLKNHRSFVNILDEAGNMLSEEEKSKLMSVEPFYKPLENFIDKYVEVYDIRTENLMWWDKISILLSEKIDDKPYKQIAILFRSNNEVYNGFQTVQSLQLENVRIRIQGSIPYEFARIRECHEILNWLKQGAERKLNIDLVSKTKSKIEQLLKDFPTWNEFYLFAIYAIIKEFIEEGNETSTYLDLVEYILEMTQKDDGQIQKLYEKHLINKLDNKLEIVLTTMHKVKGLEFDAVIIAPSFTELPYGYSKPDFRHDLLIEYIEEERRIAFVAYSRAKFRLVVYKNLREFNLDDKTKYIPETTLTESLGKAVKPGLEKIKISWAAKEFNFGINEHIKKFVKSGDAIKIQKRSYEYNGQVIWVEEIIHIPSMKVIGELANNFMMCGEHASLSGFIVNEIVTWSHKETLEYDKKYNKTYEASWCQKAKGHGYIYLVDFAGYGKPL